MVHLNHFHKFKIFITICINICFFESAYAGSLSMFNPIDLPSKKYTVYVNTQTLLVNDAFSIKGLFDDFHGKFTSKNSDYLAIGDIRYDIGLIMAEGFYMGYTYREEAMMNTSSDTMKLVNKVSNKLNLSLGRTYQVSLDTEGFEVHGFVLSKILTFYHSNTLDVKFAMSGELLHGIQIQHGSASGNALAIADKDYDFLWKSHYLYTENYLYDLEVDKITSSGYTIHMALYIQYNQMKLSAIVNDMYGKLFWKNLPYSDVKLSSDNKHYDNNGYVMYSPVLSGFEGTMMYTQTLMKKWRVEGSYDFWNSNFKLGTEYINETYLPYIEYTQAYENGIISTVSYETYFGMLGVNLRYKNYSLGIKSNDIIEPSAMKISLGLQYQF